MHRTLKTSEKGENDKIMNASEAKYPGKPSEKLERYNSECIWCKGPVKTSEKWERYHSERIWCKEPVKTSEKWEKDKIMNASDAKNPGKPSEKTQKM